MAESILFSRVDKILAKLASFAVEEFRVAWGLEADLNKLRTTLSAIKVVVLDAEEQPTSNHRITFWLKQLTDVLYDAEDVLDDVSYEALRKQVVDTASSAMISRRKVHRFLTTSNPIAFRLRIGHRIKEIRHRIDEIAAQKAQFNLAERLDNSSVSFREREMTHSFIRTSDIVGRDGDKDAIVDFLMDPSEGQSLQHNVSVISIVGIGGLGKTAVAKMVFNDPRIVNHFHQKLWVCLGDMKQFNVNQVMAKIVNDHSNPQQLQISIQNKMCNSKFLLILDDMWDVNRDKWLELKSLLACGAEGSKILVTTRISSVASCVGTAPTHKLEGLPHEECVSLFKRLAFESEEKVDQDLMNIGEEIVKKCKGVPLALRSLGSMLFSKTGQSEWLFVRDSDIWQIEENQTGILPILKFSYDHLPSHLKQCFVYCSLFPEDYEFADYLLISFWMAHGLLQSRTRNQEPEHVGKQYIKQLLSRGFFQDFHIFADENVIDSVIWKFKMHDLVRELACFLGQDEFAAMTGNDKSIPKNIRHVYFGKEQEFLTNSNNGIRTVVLTSSDVEEQESNKFAKACVSKFKHLRVLWLAKLNIAEFPNCIEIVKHLKSLDLSHCKKLKRLPKSFCKLHNLEYLSLLGCSDLEEVPKNMVELVNLKSLWLTTKQKHPSKNGIGCIASLQFLWFDKCGNLEFLFDGTKLQLPSLQTLVVRDCKSLKSMFSRALSEMNYHLPALEVIEMRDCQNLNLNLTLDRDAFSQCLCVPRLRSLRIRDLWKLEGLPEWIKGSRNTLQHLEMECCEQLEPLPEWLTDLTSLQKLVIRYCYDLSSLPQGMQRLAALKELVLAGSNFRRYRCEEEGRMEIAHVPNVQIR